ncbi:hypothetical protein ACM614_19130 [Streptomyces sp. 12297]
MEFLSWYQACARVITSLREIAPPTTGPGSGAGTAAAGRAPASSVAQQIRTSAATSPKARGSRPAT